MFILNVFFFCCDIKTVLVFQFLLKLKFWYQDITTLLYVGACPHLTPRNIAVIALAVCDIVLEV